MADLEHLNASPENTVEAKEAAGERLEQLLKTAEASPETAEDKEKNIETAKKSAIEAALGKEKGGAEKDKKQPASSPKRHGTVSKKLRDDSFKRHMTSIQRQMSTSQRLFSKFIHNKAVEKASDAVGSTVARPNAVLSGAVFAFFLVLAVYLLSRQLGYALSGFETIAAFIVGWILGVVYDYFRILILGKK